MIAEELKGKHLVFFLDFDGTLTPIVSHPDLARLTEKERAILKRLAEVYPVAIISGRDRKNVAALVALPELYYAGSHGFDIAGPHGAIAEMGQEYLPALDQAEKTLHTILDRVPGVYIERKKYAISIHFRQADSAMLPLIEEGVKRALQPSLRMSSGKKLFELQPDIPWDKGKALLHLMEVMPLKEGSYPVYIGDDLTDEDAFKVVQQNGAGIGVFEKPQPTSAKYRLKSPAEVYQLFEELLDDR